ncbi:MAG: hypothetical protein ACREDQ_09145, partial [Limisphaerales bacterium]
MIFRRGLVLITAVCLSAIARADEDGVSILVVNQGGYRPVYVDYVYGLRPILTTNLSKPVMIYQENLDFTHFTRNDYRQELAGWLRNKYRGNKLDVIVASGRKSIDFALKARASAWPGVPIIAMGNRETLTNELDGQTNVTGFIVDNDVQGTLKTAVQLLPGTRRIAFVSPGGAAGDAAESYQRDLQHAEDFCGNRFELLNLVGLTMADTKHRLAELPPGTIVFYDDIRTDGSGPVMLPWAAAEELSSVSTAPMFSYSRFYVGNGIVGGMCINNSALNSEIAGQIASVIRA